MKKTALKLTAGLLASLLPAGWVLGQPLVDQSGIITPIATAAHSDFVTFDDFVIQDPTTYRNFFNGSPPATPTVDFTKQVVLAVTLGNQPAGSSVSIPSFEIRTTGFTAGWGYVHVNSVIGTGGGGTVTGPVTISGGTITNAGGQTTISGGTTTLAGGGVTISISSGATGTSATFTGVGTTTTNTGGTVTTAGGTTTAVSGTTNDTNTGGTTTTTGGMTTITNTVIATGSTFTISGGTVTTTPTGLFVTGGTVTITGGTVTASGITTTGGTTTISGGTTTTAGTTQPYAVVAVAKGALFYGFVNDVSVAPYTGPLPFSSLNYRIGDATTPYNDSITVDGTGHITVNRSRSLTGGTTYAGQLATTELQALGGAFVSWTSTPPPLTVTDPLAPQAPILPTETLSWAANGSTYASTVLRAGFYGGSGSLKTLVDAIRGPAERVVRGTVGTWLEGTVHLNLTSLRIGSHVVSPTDPFYDLLGTLNGKEVELQVATGPTTGPITVLGVPQRLLANDVLLTFPSNGGTPIAPLPSGTPARVTGLTLEGTYMEARAEDQRGFVQSSSVTAGPSAAATAKIEDLLFQKYLQQGGLIWDGTGGAPPFTTGWVDPATGQSAPAPTQNEWDRNAGDPDRAVNIDTGQNAVYDHANQQWVDAANGQPISSSGNSPATLQDLTFQIFLQEGGLIWDGTGGAPPFTTGWVDPATGQSAPAPTQNEWDRNAGDPDRAVNIDTGQNAVYDHANQQWVDAATGQLLSPSLK